MAKKRYSIIDTFSSGTFQKVITSQQPELLVLRGHGLVEAALLTLLAARMRVAVEELPVLNSFETLARIALAGADYSLMLPTVLHLNRLRNIVAHDLQAADAEVLMAEFVSTMPPSLAEAPTKHGMLMAEVFGASLMVLMYALLQLGTDADADDDAVNPSPTEE